ncbi:MAG: hypothetical protein HY645_12500 [Acidobacteria bacterium]|nr:hypothetical protein [Acidobacteriota bacterium]
MGTTRFIHYIPVLGRNAFLTFFAITSLTVWVLVTTNVVTRYAIKGYTEEQLKQLHWDAVIYQSQDLAFHGDVKGRISKIKNVERVETLGLLRMRLTPANGIRIGGRVSSAPWFSIVSSSDPAVLPSEFNHASPRDDGSATLVMFGPQSFVGVYLDQLQIGSELSLTQKNPEGDLQIFSTRIQKVSQVERGELVKWIIGQVGSTAYVPPMGLIAVVSPERLDAEVVRLERAFKVLRTGAGVEEGGEVGQEGPAYSPQIIHLVSLQRRVLFSGWDLEASLTRVSNAVEEVRAEARKVNYNALVNSDLMLTLEKMVGNSEMVGIVGLLISIPILWMVWILSRSLAGLVSLNERRTIGLMRLRGASGSAIRSALAFSILAGGLAGSVAGILLGNLVPIFVYKVTPAQMIKIIEPELLLIFAVVAAAVAYFSGRRVTEYATRITPREASARTSPSESQMWSPAFTNFQLLALLVGGYKIVLWIADYSVQVSWLQTIDGLLNFLAAPLFIYGFTSFIISRSKTVRVLLQGLARPIAGRLESFVVENLMMKPHRVASAILIASLMFSMALYPKITADSFQDKIARGLRVNLGADLVLTFNVSDLPGGAELRSNVIREQVDKLRGVVNETIQKIASVGDVDSAEPVYECMIPGSFYIPGQASVPLFLLSDSDKFLNSVYHEPALGVGKPFTDAIQTLETGGTLISKGLVDFNRASIGSELMLGRTASREQVKVPITGAIAVLPGASRVILEDREAFSDSDVEFINHLAQSNAFITAKLDNPAVAHLQGVFSRVIILVSLRNSADAAVVLTSIESVVRPLKAASTSNFSTQVKRLSKDMFVSLALESLKLYVLGGILVALAGVVAIGIVNFLDLKRNLALLRIRGGSPRLLLRAVIADFLVPILLGMIIGSATGVLTGYGLTNYIFRIPRVLSAVVLKVQLVVPLLTWGIVGFLFTCFMLLALIFSHWTFRRSAREALRG